MPGRRTTYSGTDAARAAQRLAAWSDALEGAAAGSIRARGTLHPRLAFTTAPAGAAADLGFSIVFELQTADAKPSVPPRTVDAGTVLAAWREGLGLCPLGDGGFVEATGSTTFFTSQNFAGFGPAFPLVNPGGVAARVVSELERLHGREAVS